MILSIGIGVGAILVGVGIYHWFNPPVTKEVTPTPISTPTPPRPKKKPILKEIQTYAPITAHKNNYLTRIEYLHANQKWNELIEQLKSRTMLTLTNLKEHIEERLDAYQDILNIPKTYFNILDLHVNPLIHKDSRLTIENMEIFKTLCHLLDAEGKMIYDEGNTTESGEGWDADDFLSINIYALYNYFIRIYFNHISIPQGFEKEEFLKKLQKELVVEIETLRAYRNTKLIQSCDDNKKQSSLLKAHATNMAEHISTLELGEEYCCVTGWKTHAIYVSFVRTLNDVIAVRIDNLGAGYSDKHPKDESTQSCQPYILAYLKQSDFAPPKPNKAPSESFTRCINYLQDLCKANWLRQQESAIKLIYSKEFSNKYPIERLGLYSGTATRIKNQVLNFPFKRVQDVGNCVVRCFSVGLELRTHYDSRGQYVTDWKKDITNQLHKMYVGFYTASSELITNYCRLHESTWSSIEDKNRETEKTGNYTDYD